MWVGERNREGELLLDFLDSIEMRIMNTYFRKESEKKVTYESGDNKTQIDFMLVGKRMGMKVKDVKAVPGEVAMSQHKVSGYGCELQGKVRSEEQR